MTILILVDAGKLVNWQTELILCLNRHSRFKILLLNVAQIGDRPVLQTGRVEQLFRSGITRILDFKRPKRDAFKAFDFHEITKKAPSVEVVGFNSNRISECTLVLNLSPLLEEKRCAEFFGVPVWGMRFGKGADIDDPLASSYEILASQPVTYLSVVESLAGQEESRIVYTSASSTLFYSTRLNAAQLAWKTVECVPRLLEKVEKGPFHSKSFQLEKKKARALLCPFWKDKGPSIVLPPMFPWWFLSRFFRKVREKFFIEQWVLLTGQQTSALMPGNLTTILPPVDRIWADPFCIKRDGKLFVFFEDMPFSNWRGRISCAELRKDGSLGEVLPVLQREYHLSYPFLIEYRGELFMVPESGENRTVELYRCRSFPDQWVHAGNLMSNIEAYDATLFKHNDFWWLFANVAAVEGISTWDQLHLYYSKEFPSDNWTPHPANPIVDDVRLARPAGYLFHQDGKLIRPSQDSAVRYGRGLNFNEVIEITPNTYQEVLLEKYIGGQVSRKLCALHTINHCGGNVVLDAQVYRRKRKKSNAGKVIFRPL